ncbi:MAG: HK97 family phage prohead protease [Eubacteriales bacterium]
MPDKRITRAFNFEIRAAEEEGKGIIEGRAIVYEKKYDAGYFEETIARGALKNTNLKDVKFLVNHNIDMIPLARSRNNNENSTMHLIVDDEGLRVKIKLDIENNADAAALYSAIKRGDISGMSFMFTVRGEEWADEKSDYPKRTITDIEQVFEVSAVTFPAYEETEINARCKAELDNYRAALDSVRSDTPDGCKNGVDNKATIELLRLKNQILGGF